MFHAGARIQHVFHLAAFVCFTLAVTTRAVTLETIPSVDARCGENVTLGCIASLPDQTGIRLFEWLMPERQKKLCSFKGEGGDEGTLCMSAEEPQHTLNVTLLNVMPIHQGKYICKLHSTKGMKDSTTLVRIKECFGDATSSINESHATCSYSGVYPDGTVHWLGAEGDLTSSALITKEKDHHNLHLITSTIKVQSRNSYNCSLWLPYTMKYVSRQQLHAPGIQNALEDPRSSGNLVALHWLSMVLEIAIVRFMW